MTLSFKPHVLALLCSGGILMASAVLFVKSRTHETVAPAFPSVSGSTIPSTTDRPASSASVTYSLAQIDQWVAPVALYPDNLLSQILMASTYPENVEQAEQWSRGNPSMQGDAAVRAVAGQAWDPSVKSLVAFPTLLALMSENNQWVRDLGHAFLAQPQDVTSEVQKLRAMAQQTGALTSTPQQTVTTIPHTDDTQPAQTTAKTNGTTIIKSTPPATSVIKIESADPQVVYVPTYNPATVYGTWPAPSAPPVYLPPTPGQQFAGSFASGLGFSLGVATTYALFSNINWGNNSNGNNSGSYTHNGNNNININVNNYNHITGQNIHGNTIPWEYHPTNVPGGLSATQQTGTSPSATSSLSAQRQSASQQFRSGIQQGNYHPGSVSGGLSATQQTSLSSQRQAASQQFQTAIQRNPAGGNHAVSQRSAQPQVQKSYVSRGRSSVSSPSGVSSSNSGLAGPNALSGNGNHSPSWQAQQQRGLQSRRLSGLSPLNSATGTHPSFSGNTLFHR